MGLLFFLDADFFFLRPMNELELHPQITSDELADMYRSWCKDYPIVTIEDVFDQDDWDAWSKLMPTVGTVQIVGFVSE